MEFPIYTKIHNRFLLNGYNYNRNGLKEVAYSFIKEGDYYEKFMGDFLMDWLDSSEMIYIETSGTTITPKRILFKKQALVNSAIVTGDFFNVSKGDKALHCLPASFIAGKMMMIRAIILGLSLDLVSPSKKPFYKNNKTYDFVAMTPMQAFHSLSKMNQIKKLIIGGSFISNTLQEALIKKKVNAFETYGMTETLSHIAVRSIEEHSLKFKCLPNISIGQDERGCLIINAPQLNVENLITNDEIELLDQNSFRLIGRVDNVINSGGVKIHPEQLERKLSAVLSVDYFIGSIADSELGQKVILVVLESNEIDAKVLVDQLKLCDSLSSYEFPKKILFFKNFIETSGGKIKRKYTLEQTPNRVLDL